MLRFDEHRGIVCVAFEQDMKFWVYVNETTIQRTVKQPATVALTVSGKVKPFILGSELGDYGTFILFKLE